MSTRYLYKIRKKNMKNKINTVRQLIREQIQKLLTEGEFSWITQDTKKQIGSEKQNTITVYMYDNEGHKWVEKAYEGFGEFGGKDYYELVAEMNGYTTDDLGKGKRELRDIGIDVASGKLKTKNEDKKTLYPALVQKPNYNWRSHNFTKEAKRDPHQGWYTGNVDAYGRSTESYNAEEDKLEQDPRITNRRKQSYTFNVKEDDGEASPSLHGLGTFRRVVITSPKIKVIQKEIETLMKRPEIKSSYPVKFSVKPGVVPNTIVIDLNGKGAATLSQKMHDLAVKNDKQVVIKIKKEIKRTPVK